MKVLGFSGSPRKNGNTEYAIKTALNIIRKKIQQIDTEFILITDVNIDHCKGCRYCMTHVECAIKDDDLEFLVDKMISTDLIILGAPIYWYGPPGIFKDFIDRTHAFYPDEKRFKGKKVAVITIAAQSGFPSHEKIMSWLQHYGAEYIGWLRLYAREKDELRKKPKQKKKLEIFTTNLTRLLKMRSNLR